MTSNPNPRALRARRLAAALLASGALLMIAPAAFAQTRPVQVADASDQIGDVTVIARKREENVQSVPIAITVIIPQELTRQNLVKMLSARMFTAPWWIANGRQEAGQLTCIKHLLGQIHCGVDSSAPDVPEPVLLVDYWRRLVSEQMYVLGYNDA